MWTVLHGQEVPPKGGDTWFTDMYAAYDTLPGDLKGAADRHGCKHDGTYNSAGELRGGYEDVSDVTEAPGATHSLVCRHPEIGRSFLYLGRRRNAYVEGLDVEESETLLDRLWSHACGREDAIYRHKWRAGDVVMWDNQGTMHRRDSFDDAHRRVMIRTTVQSAAPITA